MEYKFYLLTGLIFLFIGQPAIGDQTAEFKGDMVSFSYSNLMYSQVISSPSVKLCDDSDGTCLKAFYIKLERRRPLGGLISDSGNVCLGSVVECAEQRPDFGYYVDPDGEVNVSPPGQAKNLSRVGQWDIIESYPLCAWSDLERGFQPYGGQCYAIVLMTKSKTVSFNLLLGKAGCKDVFKCWSVEVSRIRKMIDSVR